MAVRTIKVNTAAIFFFNEAVGGVTVGRPPLVSQFVKEVCRLCLTRSPRAPSWDRPSVLRSLTQPLYEPLDQFALNFLSHNTAFVLALCSAKRVGE